MTVNFEGGGVMLELEAKTDAERLALDEGVVEEESRVVFKWRERRLAKVLGDNFGHRRKGARASLAGSDFLVDALDKR